MNIGDSMVLGESRITNMVLRMLGTDVIKDIDNYVVDVCSRKYLVMNSVEQVKNIFGQSLDNFVSSLSEEDMINLRSYTGYNFRNINAVLRCNWTYEVNGVLNREKEEDVRRLSETIGELVGKFIIPKVDFITFRGVSLDSFDSYGIRELSQLDSLRGKFLYEQGFTSTSVLEDTCYFNKDLNDGKKYNVLIRYLISSECNDGALLVDNSTSYSINQNEFLLNKGSLSKVIDVKIDDEMNIAVLTVVLVPKKIWDRTEDKIKSSAKNI